MKIKLPIFFLLFVLFFDLNAQSAKKLFANAEDLIEKLKDLDAETFSPLNYEAGMKLYNRARKMSEEGKSSEEIYDVLQEAESRFYKALERAQINGDLFFYANTLRESAEEKAGQSVSAKPFLLAGEKAFREGIFLSEKEKPLPEIKKKLKEAIDNFQASKIIAKKERVFAPVVKLREKAKKEKAEIFAPDNFTAAENKFNAALDFALKNNGEDFIKSLLAAENFYKQAIASAEKFTGANKDLLTAMKYADKSGAKIFAKEKYEEALSELRLSAKAFEKEDYKLSEKKALAARKLFWDAEKKALYEKYIGRHKAKLELLKKSVGFESAKLFARKAELLLEKAEKLFKKNRYDKKVTEYSVKAEKEIERIERITNLYATKSRKYIDSLILNEIYPFGLAENPGPEIKSEIETKQRDTSEQVNEKAIAQTLKKTKQNRPAKKEKTKTEKVENKTPLEKTLEYCKRVFKPDEAVVVEKNGKTFRLRLVGLKLKAYQKKLTPNQKNLLMKLKNVISFSGKVKKTIIEVYSDSMGGNELNKRLSQSRANIVKATLVKYGLKPDRIIAEGIGNKNPIASNDTFEGRNKNRRIEVILVF